MKPFFIRNKSDGSYWRAPGKGTVNFRRFAHAYTRIPEAATRWDSSALDEKAHELVFLTTGEIAEFEDAGLLKKMSCKASALEALYATLAWIDAVPQDTELPVMPGFDRDWVDGVVYLLEQEVADED